MADFLLYALLAGCGVAVAAGPLGSLIVWQRLAYFGDTLAHSALLGAALGLLLAVDPWLTVLGVAVAIGTILALLQGHPQLNADSLLGILSHGSLALGLVAISLFDGARIDLNSYLFGDLLAVAPADLWLIAAMTTVVLAGLALCWDALLAITVHPELAAVNGRPVTRLRLLLMVAVAMLVAAAMKVVGVLLVTALLIIPANAARPWSRTPEQMALLAAALGVIAVAAGLAGSWWLDTPTGPSIVTAAALLFVLSYSSGRVAGRGQRA
ncbi:MAG: metal ABC transporter permease [Spongiibacteraceae bacterium]|jgi:zinc transport system permease protein|nr:metal ABC transporter permease [Spongiibacteraceae bacterium]